MTIALNSVRSTRLFISTLLLLLSFGVVSRPSLAKPPGTGIATPAPVNSATTVTAETLTAEQWNARGDDRFTTDIKSAIEAYTQAIKLAPKEVNYYYSRARAYAENNDKLLALADYNQIIKLQPESADAYGSRAIFYCYKDGDYQKAIADWDQVVKLMPTSVSLSQRADCLVKSGDHKNAIVGYTKAIEWSKQALGSDPKVISWTDAETYISRGKSYQAIGDSKAAIADFDQAMKVKSDEFVDAKYLLATAYYQRALVKLSLGQKAEALKDFKAAAERNENAENYEEIMKYIKELQ
jgi:tetratricopeptide (TPR) repeat protein